MKITACPRCRSTNIDVPDLSDGETPGRIPGVKVCRDCEWQGIPFEFSSEHEYQQFLQGVQKEKEKETNSLVHPDDGSTQKKSGIRPVLLRELWPGFLVLSFFIFPGLAFVSVSVYGGLPDELGGISALLVFIVYTLFVLKTKLWNKVKM